MDDLIMVSCSGQIVEGAHISCISGVVIEIIRLMNRFQLLDKRVHHGHISPHDSAVEQGLTIEIRLIKTIFSAQCHPLS
jgi:hypothetical protein